MLRLSAADGLQGLQVASAWRAEPAGSQKPQGWGSAFVLAFLCPVLPRVSWNFFPPGLVFSVFPCCPPFLLSPTLPSSFSFLPFSPLPLLVTFLHPFSAQALWTH